MLLNPAATPEYPAWRGEPATAEAHIEVGEDTAFGLSY